MNQSIKRLMIICACLLFFPASNINSQQNSYYGGKLILYTTSDPRSFNPILAKETSTTAITSIIFEGLTRTNAFTLEVEPNLAAKWEVDETGFIWTFYLRQDVFWQDGKRFSADDVIFTFNDLIYNPEIPNSARDIFTIDNKTISVEKIDDWTVKFILPRRFAPFLRSMNTEILPKHCLERLVQEKKFNFSWSIDSNPKEIVGTGPFKLSRYLPGERIELARNNLYWKEDSEKNGLPYLDGIIFLIVPNQDTALLKFQEGEIDYYSLRGIDYQMLKPKEKKYNFTVYQMGAGFGSSFLVFNLNPSINPITKQPYLESKKFEWFNNLGFRKALAHCIDKEKIIEIVLQGFGYPQIGPESPSSSFFYNPNVVSYPYDLKKAKGMLAENSFLDRNNDGIREDKNGNKIEFNIFTVAGSDERMQIASIIRKDLASIGIIANLVPIEFNALVAKLVSTFDWDVVLIALTGGIEPHFGRNVWHSSGQLHMWNPQQKTAKTEWERRIDEIFDLAVQELDENKRKKLYDEWQFIVTDNTPLIYTVLADVMFAVRNKFGNLKPTPYGGAFHNLEEIYCLRN